MEKLKKNKKPIFTILICAVIICAVIGIVSFAADTAAQTSYTDTSNGNNVKYEMKDSNKTLKITGSGTITNVWQDQLYTKNYGYYFYGEIEKILIDSDELTGCDKNAFSGRSISNGLTRIDGTKAYSMVDLTEVKIASYNKSGSYNWNSLAFQGNGTIITLTLGSECRSLAEGAFKNCSKLENVDKTKNMTTISKEAFMNTALGGITNMDVVTEVKERAFMNTNLRSINLSNVTQIKESAFEDCKGLEEVTVKKVTNIGKRAFYNCLKLSTIGTNEETVINGKESGFILNSLLPESLAYVGESAFHNCRGLTRLRFQNTSCTIFDSADTLHDTITIVGYGGKNEETTAKKYAEKYSRLFFHYESEKIISDTETANEYIAKDGSENFGAIYRFECYGAAGGNGKGRHPSNIDPDEPIVTFSAGSSVGAYTKGCIQLLPGDSLYVFVGKEGKTASSETSSGTGGWNGGGNGTTATNSWSNQFGKTGTVKAAGGGGGGAVDIRTNNSYDSSTGKFKDINGDGSVNSSDDTRVMVAAGGSGGSIRTYVNSTTEYNADMEVGGGGNPVFGVDLARSNNKLFTGSNGLKYEGNDDESHPDANAGGGGGGGAYGGKTEANSSGNREITSFKGTNRILANSFAVFNKNKNTTHLVKFLEEGDTYYTEAYQNVSSGDGGSSGDGYCIITLEEIVCTKIHYHSNREKDDTFVETKFKIKETDYTIADCFDYEEFEEGIFLGWNTKKDGTGTVYMPGDIYTLDNDLDLYAIWLTVDLSLTNHGNYQNYDGMFDAVWYVNVGCKTGSMRTRWDSTIKNKYDDTDVTYTINGRSIQGNNSGRYTEKDFKGGDNEDPDYVEGYRDLASEERTPISFFRSIEDITEHQSSGENYGFFVTYGKKAVVRDNTTIGKPLTEDKSIYTISLLEASDNGSKSWATVTAKKNGRTTADQGDVTMVSGTTKYHYAVSKDYAFIDTRHYANDNPSNAMTKRKILLSDTIEITPEMDTKGFNKFFVDISDNLKTYEENEYFWLTVVAEDGAGNMGQSITMKVPVDCNPEFFDIYTDKLTVTSESTTTLNDGTVIYDNVYQATGEMKCDSYYVRADGTTPFIVNYNAIMQAPSAYMSEIIGFHNWNIIENTLSGLTTLSELTASQKFRNYPPTTYDATATYDNSSITKNNAAGDNWGQDAENTTIKRINSEGEYKKETTMSYPMTVDSSMDGIIRYIRPFASGNYTLNTGNETIEKTVDSNPTNEEIKAGIDNDKANTVRIIPDGEGPEVKNLNDIYKFSRLSSDTLLDERTCTIEAEDSLSGMRSIKIEILNLDNGMYKVYHSDGDSIKIIPREDEIWYIGEFIVKVTAVDNVGNITEVSQRAYSTDMDAELFRILEPHDNIFQAGESGTISIETEGYIDTLKLEFSTPVTPYENAVYPEGYSVSFNYIDANDDSVPVKYKKITEMYIHCDFDEIETDEAGSANPEIDFMVPVYTKEGTYSVKVKAFKNEEELTYLEKDLPFIVQGTILDDFRTRIRSAN